jgi:LmbE family N-acetylglucosaminyl deacetylase
MPGKIPASPFRLGPSSPPGDAANWRRPDRSSASHLCRPLGHGDGLLRDVDPDRLVGEIVFFLRRHRPDVVLTFGPEGAPTQHRDHRLISRAATAGYFLAALPTEYADQLREVEPHQSARLYYCAWESPAPGSELMTLSLAATCCIDVAAYLQTKRAAFLAHATQRQH